MTTIADIVRAHGKEYLQKFGVAVPVLHRKALRDIAACHTPEMGGHRYRCEDCGEEHFRYHSCRNRSCPSCQGAERRDWVDARLADVLPCRYFHLVFTVPAALNRLIRSNQEILLNALMRAAGDSLREMAGNPDHLGGRIGVLEVLHTWGGNLEYHPHVHCLVPGGAWRTDGRVWTTSSSTFFLPVKALSRLFRGKFLALAKAAFPGELPKSLWDQEWVVFSKPVTQGPEKVLGYLGRYIHRTAISDRSIRSLHDGQVTFEYRDHRSARRCTMTLPVLEFLRRFLQHVLPRGFHQVRHLGMLHPSSRAALRRLQLILWREAGRFPPETPAPKLTLVSCPVCGSHRTNLVEVNYRSRGPPDSHPKDGRTTSGSIARGL